MLCWNIGCFLSRRPAFCVLPRCLSCLVPLRSDSVAWYNDFTPPTVAVTLLSDVFSSTGQVRVGVTCSDNGLQHGAHCRCSVIAQRSAKNTCSLLGNNSVPVLSLELQESEDGSVVASGVRVCVCVCVCVVCVRGMLCARLI